MPTVVKCQRNQCEFGFVLSLAGTGTENASISESKNARYIPRAGITCLLSNVQ